MTGHSRHIANASQSYTLPSRTSRHTNQSFQKSMPVQTHGDRKVGDRKEQQRHNSTYPKGGVLCSKDSLVVADPLSLRCGRAGSFVLRNRQLRQAANSYITVDNR